jgi:branched-chain amino acid transport system permease protein
VLGVNLAMSKVITFGISAAIAGLGGSLSILGKGVSVVSPNAFSIVLSIELLVAVVVGGVATILGPAIGAAFIEFLPDLIPASTPEQRQLTPFIFGAALILLMVVAPGGIVGLIRKTWATIRRRTIDRGGGGTPAAAEDALASAPAAPAAGGG